MAFYDKFKIIEASSAEGRNLLTSLKTEGFVAFVGSATSMWDTCDLPTGSAMTGSVANLLAGYATSHPDIIKKLIASTAFEHAMESCPQKEILGDNLLRLYRPAKPNAIHMSLANLLQQGVIKHIITTNYDPCLEAACQKIHQSVQIVITKEEADAVDVNHPVLFKIHGCAVKDSIRQVDEPRSMVYSLSHEGELLDWKRQLLYRLAVGNNLLICGYSGLDFEICPEIHKLGAHYVIWNCLDNPNSTPETLTANASRVLNATGGTSLVGDMRNLFGSLTGVGTINVSPAKTIPNLHYEISKGLSNYDLNLWALTLYNRIGCATQGIRLAKRMYIDAKSTEHQAEVLRGLGQALFHQGSYMQAAKCYNKALAVSSNRIAIELDIVEAERCAGYRKQAWNRLENLEKLISTTDVWFKSMVLLRKVLLQRHQYQLAMLFRRHHDVVKIRAYCKDLLRQVTLHAADRGSWLELQQCKMWAERLNIPFSEIYSGPMTPLPALEGYRQIGYFVAETMAIRDALQEGKPVPPPEELMKRVETLWKIGAGAEMWKLSWMLLRKKVWNALSWGLLKRAIYMWKRCEYTRKMRIFVTFRP